MNFRLQSLTIGYRTGRHVKTVAADICADIEANKLTCLIGSNGAGKSTLLKTLSAFLPPLSGNILVDGKNLTDYNHQELARIVSVVLTSRPDVDNMTARDIVGLGRTPYTGFWGKLNENDKHIVDECMQLVGINHLAERMTGTLSEGERQKVMIAKALAQQTPMIILDEPTAFLDYPSKVEIMQLLAHLSHEKGKTIFMSTHDLELTLQTADKLWLMQRHKLSVGTTDELSANGVLSDFINRPGVTFDPHHHVITMNIS